jgi:hypothetical protein
VKIIDCAQRSPEWVKARLGMLTGSCANDMLSTRRDGKEAAGRRNLRMRLVLERITGRCLESEYVSAAMQQGMDREADAAALYEAETGILLRSVGFCAHDDLMTGYSPDGVIGDFQGIAEIKSPLPATHWEYLRTGVVPTEYHRQVLHGLFITGAQWCDWISYNPDFPEPLRTKLVRIERTVAEMNFHEVAVRAFLRECDDEYAAVQRMAMVAVA